MLRFIVYRYISYKDSKISHASLLALRHHLSQLPPALLPTSQLHDLPLPYSTQLYYTPHCLTTSTCSTPPSPTTHLTPLRPVPALLHPALLPISLPYSCTHDLPYSTQPCHLHTTYPSTRLSILDPPTLPMCTLLPIHSCAITCYTYYPAHTCHTPHRPAHLPHRCTMPPLYPIGSTTPPYLSLLYLPFSSATFIGLIRPIAPIRPIPTRARIGQVVGVIGLIGAIGLIGLIPP